VLEFCSIKIVTLRCAQEVCGTVIFHWCAYVQVFEHAAIQSRQQEARAKQMSLSFHNYSCIMNSELETKSSEQEHVESLQHHKGLEKRAIYNLCICFLTHPCIVIKFGIQPGSNTTLLFKMPP
jgi:hypothetical protein